MTIWRKYQIGNIFDFIIFALLKTKNYVKAQK